MINHFICGISTNILVGLGSIVSEARKEIKIVDADVYNIFNIDANNV